MAQVFTKARLGGTRVDDNHLRAARVVGSCVMALSLSTKLLRDRVRVGEHRKADDTALGARRGHPVACRR